jgi:hypothetical protein
MRMVGRLDEFDGFASRLIMVGEDVLEEPLHEESTGLEPTIFAAPTTGLARSFRSNLTTECIETREATSGEACASSWLRVRTVAGSEM